MVDPAAVSKIADLHLDVFRERPSVLVVLIAAVLVVLFVVLVLVALLLLLALVFLLRVFISSSS